MDQTIRRRQLWNLLLLVACIIAISLATVVVIGAEDPFASPADDPDRTAPDTFPAVDEPGTVGGGSIGGASVNPVGEGINTTNPLESTAADEQFRVETDRPQHWRINAYDQYEDGEWIRTGATTAYTDRLSPTGATTDTAEQTITLQTNATMLPAPWQPAEVDLDRNEVLGVSAEYGIDLAQQQSAGTVYTMETYGYDPDPAALVTPSGEPPQTITQQYGDAESASTELKAISETITADTTTAAEAACAVQEWLQANYEYNRTSTPTNGDPVETFLFETETGNAEYFASSMTTLLQSQEIPARYVTGYSPGEAHSDTEGTYSVYEANTHAWTEVYVAGHGWIPFDPTPSDDRVAAEQSHIDPDGELVDHTLTEVCDADTAPALPPADEIGDEDDPSNGDENDDDPSNGDSPTNGDDPSNGDENGDQPENGDEYIEVDPDSGIDTEYTLLISDDTLMPGNQVTLIVQDDETPVSGTDVFVNGEHVGTTAEDGTLTITVPYAAELKITLGSANTVGISASAGMIADDITEQSYTVPVTGSLSVVTNPTPLIADGTATVYVTIGETRVVNASVAVAGEHAGTTDEEGTVTIEVPDEDGDIEVTAERGELTTTQSHEAVPLQLSADRDRILALPGQNTTVTLTAGDQPVTDAPVTVGETTTYTDADGTATVPVAVYQTTIAGEHAGAEVTHSIQNLLVVGVGGIIGGVLFVIGGTVGIRRYTTIPRRATTIAQSMTQRLFRVLSRIEAGIQTLGTKLDEGAGAAGKYVLNRIKQGIKWLTSINITAGLAVLFRGIVAVLWAPVRWVTSFRRETDESSTTTTEDGTAAQTEVQRSIREIWHRFVSLVRPQQATTTTPAEIAQQAVRIGLPEQPVKRLLETFRKAEYGPPEQQSEQLANDAADALAEMEDKSQDQSKEHDK